MSDPVPVMPSSVSSSTGDVIRQAMSGGEMPGYGALPDQDGESAYDVQALSLDPSQDADSQKEESADQQGSAEDAKPPEVKPPEAKPLVVRDADGKAFRMKVDLSNAEHVQTLAQQAFESRGLKTKLAALEAKSQEHVEYGQERLEVTRLMENEGIGAVVDYLVGQPGSFEKKIEEERQRRNLTDSLDPEERAAALKLSELDQRERSAEAREKALKAREEQSQEQLSQAEKAQHQSMFNGAWFKNELSGKLGDAALEERLNKAAFNAIDSEVRTLQTKGVKLSQADYNRLVESEFSLLSRGFKSAADRQAKQETQASKTAASRALDVRAGTTPISNSSPQRKAEQDYSKSGNMLDLIRAFLK